MLALLLLGLLIVCTLGLFLSLLGSSAKGNEQSIGVIYADRVLESAALTARAGYPAFDPALTGGQPFYDQDKNNQTTFVYSVTASELTPGVTAPGQTWLLEAEVRWWSTDQARARVGSGNQFVRQARVVYVPR